MCTYDPVPKCSASLSFHFRKILCNLKLGYIVATYAQSFITRGLVRFQDVTAALGLQSYFQSWCKLISNSSSQLIIEQGKVGWRPVRRNSTKIPPMSKDTQPVRPGSNPVGACCSVSVSLDIGGSFVPFLHTGPHPPSPCSILGTCNGAIRHQ